MLSQKKADEWFVDKDNQMYLFGMRVVALKYH